METIEETQTEPQVALVKIDPKEFGLDEKQSLTIEQAFAPKVAEREGLRIMYEQILTKELSAETSAEAREIRLKLVPVGTGLKKIHTTQKAVALSFGKYCDALYNAELAPVEQMKEKLFEIEKWAEIQEEKRVAKLQEIRIIILKQFEVDGSLMLVGSMTDDIWTYYLSGVKMNYEAKKQREDSVRKAALAKAISDKAIAEAQAKADKLAAELKAKADAEAKVKSDQVKAEKLAQVAPDRSKLRELAKTISFIECANLKSDEAKKIWQEVSVLLGKIIEHINKRITHPHQQPLTGGPWM